MVGPQFLRLKSDPDFDLALAEMAMVELGDRRMNPSGAVAASELGHCELCGGRSEDFSRFDFDELRDLATIPVKCIRCRIARSRQVDWHDCLH